MNLEKIDKEIKSLCVPSMMRLLKKAYKIIGYLEFKNFLLEKKIKKLKGDIKNVVEKAG